jgi:predicted phage terminase large subunit-like protein
MKTSISPAAMHRLAKKHAKLTKEKRKKPGTPKPRKKRYRGVVELPEELLSKTSLEISDDELRAIYDEVAIERELGIRSMREFSRLCWPKIHPGDPYIENAWHSDCLSDHLEAVAKGEIKKLLISVPPGHGKSTWSCVFLPVWMWLESPWAKMGFGSYSYDNVRRDSQHCINLMKSSWFKQRWGDKFDLVKTDQRNVKTSMGGVRSGMSVGGQVLGIRANLVVADDPLNIDQVDSENARATVHFWWEHGMRSRMDVRGREIVIQQRLHDRDLIGYLQAEIGGYEELILPSHYDPKRRCVTNHYVPNKNTGVEDKKVFWEDPRTEPGELLFEALYPESYLAEQVGNTDRSRNTASAMWEQNPVQEGGNIIKNAWLRYYQKSPEEQFKDCSRAILSCDLAVKDKVTSSFTVIQIWGIKYPKIYLIDQLRMRLNFVGKREALVNMIAKWNGAKGPGLSAKLIEDKASGPDIIDVLQDLIPGLIAFDGNDDKEERMEAISYLFEAGNIYIPGRPPKEGQEGSVDFSHVPWVPVWVDEITRFPKASFTDQAVTMSQAMVYISRSMKNLRGVPISTPGRGVISNLVDLMNQPREL